MQQNTTKTKEIRKKPTSNHEKLTLAMPQTQFNPNFAEFTSKVGQQVAGYATDGGGAWENPWKRSAVA